MAKNIDKSKKPKVKLFRRRKKPTSELSIISQLQSKYENIDETKIRTFDDLPLSSKTLKALRENNFIVPTDIQKQSIGLALAGNDILGAAKTGSGKTLAFLIPVLEILYCKQWSRDDKLGALVISPTRELATQIYETLVKIGKHHDFSAGLVIGGKDLKFERNRMGQCNIIICTPGRLLHHMDNNPLFDSTTMQIVVLDEADRCLDMGFEADMNAIIENLPAERQTLLFSATQTKSVKDLARLSLKNPIYVSVHEHAKHTTPEGLQQSYVICKLEDKMSMLWSFIRHHLKQKIIIFFSSCKQVKFANDALCRMRPGISILALHGKLHQLKRMEIYNKFCGKQIAVLLATDIAARGLDFPAVNWVVQMDCPEDTNAYIHRAGRTARFQSGGESLLVLLPSEEEMIQRLEDKKIPINMIKIHPDKLHSPQKKLEALLARDSVLKETAQRAFIAYIKSVHLMKDKKIFNVRSLDTDAYAKSLGLAFSPRIRFLERQEKNKKAAVAGKLEQEEEYQLDMRRSSDDESGAITISRKKNKKPEKIDVNDDGNKLKKDETIKEALFDSDESDADELFTVKRKNIKIDDAEPVEELDDLLAETKGKNKRAITKAAVAKKVLKKKIKANKKTTFNDEGEEVVDTRKSKVSELAREYDKDEESGINIERAREVLMEEDKFDKQRFREMVKEKHREEKRKAKAQKKGGESDEEDDDDDEDDENEAPRLPSGSDDSDGPDLSWLPDPDKIYGPKKDSSDEKSNSDFDDEEIEKIHRPSKRKLITKDDENKKKKQKMRMTENSNLLATEELALQLLRS